jgi:hypothetical protein
MNRGGVAVPVRKFAACQSGISQAKLDRMLVMSYHPHPRVRYDLSDLFEELETSSC